MRGVAAGLGVQSQGAVTMKQCLHRHRVIHAGAVPQGNTSAGVDIQTLLAVQCFDIGVAKKLRGVCARRSLEGEDGM
jgi:hypothetical protein